MARGDVPALRREPHIAQHLERTHQHRQWRTTRREARLMRFTQFRRRILDEALHEFVVMLGENREWEVRIRNNGEGLEIRNRDGERIHVTMDASNSVRLQLAEHFAREHCEDKLREIQVSRDDAVKNIEAAYRRARR